MPDPVLADLAGRVLDRRLFDYDSPEYRNEIQAAVIAAGWDPNYYLYQDQQRQDPYRPYKGDDDTRIWVLRDDGAIAELSTVSAIAASLAATADQQDTKVFYPKGVWHRD